MKELKIISAPFRKVSVICRNRLKANVGLISFTGLRRYYILVFELCLCPLKSILL